MSSLWRPIRLKNKPPYSKKNYYIRYDHFTIRKVTVKKLSQNTVSHRIYTPGNTVIWHPHCMILEGSSCITFINSEPKIKHRKFLSRKFRLQKFWSQKILQHENFHYENIDPNSIPKMGDSEPIWTKIHQKWPILTRKWPILSQKSHKTVESVIQRILKCQ